MLYLGGLSYGALSIYNSITERRTLVDREFDGLADLVSSAGVLGFMNEPFIQTIQDAIDNSETLLGAVITGSRGEFAFERERGTVINWVNDSPRFVPRFGVTNPPKYQPLQITGQRNANIYAVSGYLDYDYCITVLKKTLLIVLSSLTLAFFTLLMDALLAKNRLRDSRTPGEGKAPEEPEGRTPEDENSGARPESVEPEQAEDKAPVFEGEAPSDALNFDFGEGAAAEMPQGLFSPRGGIGWEAYTGDRLSSELHRCASTEQDLALITAVIKEPGAFSDEQFRRFCEEAVLFFEHRDLIFEYGEQGISIILPNINLEQAFAQSEEFNNRLPGKLSLPANSRLDLRFGISSRAGRLIDAKQIMLEAGEALERASGDPSACIVAFKSDPEKYRQFINKRR
jgi:hypothetical protein